MDEQKFKLGDEVQFLHGNSINDKTIVLSGMITSFDYQFPFCANVLVSGVFDEVDWFGVFSKPTYSLKLTK